MSPRTITSRSCIAGKPLVLRPPTIRAHLRRIRYMHPLPPPLPPARQFHTTPPRAFEPDAFLTLLNLAGFRGWRGKLKFFGGLTVLAFAYIGFRH
ncbi:hypothetical protein KEM55_004995, partial [Ascosphaera atra]